MRLVDIEQRDGRWYHLGGEITAPFWDDTLRTVVAPPWWPIYTDRATGETINVWPVWR